MKSLLCFYCILLLLAGCSPLSNKVDDLAVQCSIPANSTGRYLKVLDPQGQSYQGVAARRLQASLLDASRTKISLPLTDGGCVRLPDQAGLVTVVDGASRQSLSTELGMHLDSTPTVMTGTLQPLSEFSLNLTCPVEGLYADDSLQTPENLVFNGDMRGLEFRLDLYSAKNQFIRRLFDKKMGQGTFLHNSSINVSDLPEGSYLIKLYGRHVANGLDADLTLLNADKDCALFVVHGDVKVKGIESVPFTVVAKGSSLNWKAEKFGEQLLVCRESGSGCQAHGACMQSENFQRVDEVIAQDSGVFDYYAFAKDQLGRKSPVSCQTVIVSDSKPTLSVEWEAEDLKPVGSVLRKPYATIKARASFAHSLLDAKTLEKNLQCKVSFELRGRDELIGNSVICTSGRCKGQSMGAYVPCDADIKFSLVEAWEQPLVSSSRLRLSVRSSDGVGHTAEAEASFWINKTTWQLEALDYVADGKSREVLNFAVTKKGTVLGFFYNDEPNFTLLRHVDGEWKGFPELGKTSLSLFAKKIDGTVAALVNYSDELDYYYDYLEFDDDGGIAKKINAKKDFGGRCEYFSIDRSDRPWCFNSEKVQYFVDGAWHELPDLKVFRTQPDEALYLPLWRIASDGRVFGLSQTTTLYIHENGNEWKRLDLKEQLKNRVLSGLVEDHKGRIWLITHNLAIGETDELFLLNADNSLVGFPSPKALGRFTTTAAEASPPQLMELQIGFSKFSFVSDSWASLDGFNASPSPGLGVIVSRLNPDGRTNIGFMNHGFYEFNSEPLYWPLRNFGSTCCEAAVRVNDEEIVFGGNLAGEYRLFRHKTYKASKFDSSMIEFQGNYSVDNWIDSEGVPVFVLGNGSMIRLKGDSIETSPVKFPNNLRRVYPLRDERYCVSASLSVSIVHADSRNEMILPLALGETAYNCVEDDKGRVWVQLNTARKAGFAEKDGSFQPIFELSDPAEQIYKIFPAYSSRKVLIQTNRRIISVSTDTDSSVELRLPVEHDIINLARLSSREFLLEFMDAEQKSYRYIVNEKDGSMVAETTLEAFDLRYFSAAIQVRGDKAWGLAFKHDGRMMLLIREFGVWKQLATNADFNPWPDTPAPLAFAPDLAGHIWIMSQFPSYEFYRYDP